MARFSGIEGNVDSGMGLERKKDSPATLGDVLYDNSKATAPE
jgi:hypothetical protein